MDRLTHAYDEIVAGLDYIDGGLSFLANDDHPAAMKWHKRITKGRDQIATIAEEFHSETTTAQRISNRLNP